MATLGVWRQTPDSTLWREKKIKKTGRGEKWERAGGGGERKGGW